MCYDVKKLVNTFIVNLSLKGSTWQRVSGSSVAIIASWATPALCSGLSSRIGGLHGAMRRCDPQFRTAPELSKHG